MPGYQASPGQPVAELLVGEAAQPLLARATWRMASYTQGNGACVEVAGLGGGRVAVRDTKDRPGPAIVMTADV